MRKRFIVGVLAIPTFALLGVLVTSGPTFATQTSPTPSISYSASPSPSKSCQTDDEVYKDVKYVPKCQSSSPSASVSPSTSTSASVSQSQVTVNDNLPVTGSSLTGLLLAAFVLLAGGGAFVYFTNRRNKETA